MSRAAAIGETMQEFLTIVGTGQEDAFETLNNIMFVSLGQDVAYTQNLLLALVPIMRRLLVQSLLVLSESRCSSPCLHADTFLSLPLVPGHQ